MKICPGCGAMLADNTKFCTNCGRKLIEEVEPQAGKEQPEQPVDPQAGKEQPEKPVDPAQPQGQFDPAVALPQYPAYPAAPSYEQTYAAQQLPQINYTATQQAAAAPVGGKGLGIAALACGIASVVTAFMCCQVFLLVVALVTGVLAIVFGTISKKQAKDGPKNGMATAGVVLGIVGLALTVVMFIVWITAILGLGFSNYGNSFGDYSDIISDY